MAISNRRKRPDPSLLRRIEELETLLEQQKQQRLKRAAVRPRARAEEIPVLYDVVTEQSIAARDSASHQAGQPSGDPKLRELIGRVDQDTGSDLEQFIKILKNGIIDELKTDLIKELKPSGREPN